MTSRYEEIKFLRRDLRQRADDFANPLVNRTRNGMPPLGLVSFWPKRVIPLRAGYRER